ncbi:hypothetical protein D3C87_1772510 [compost metagenome]
MHEIGEIGAELHEKRLVEAEFVADVGDRLRRGAAAGDHPGRIGRQGVKQQEGDGRDTEQDKCRLDEPPQDQENHLSPSRAGWDRGYRAAHRPPG